MRADEPLHDKTKQPELLESEKVKDVNEAITNNKDTQLEERRKMHKKMREKQHKPTNKINTTEERKHIRLVFVPMPHLLERRT